MDTVLCINCIVFGDNITEMKMIKNRLFRGNGVQDYFSGDGCMRHFLTVVDSAPLFQCDVLSRMRMSEDLFLEAEMVIVKDIGNENQFTLFNPTEETVKLVLDWRHSGTIKMVHVKDCDGEDSIGYCGVIAGTLKQHRSDINRVVMFNTFEER